MSLVDSIFCSLVAIWGLNYVVRRASSVLAGLDRTAPRSLFAPHDILQSLATRIVILSPDPGHSSDIHESCLTDRGMDDSLSDLEADEVGSVYESDSDLEQDSTTPNPGFDPPRRHSLNKSREQRTYVPDESVSTTQPARITGPDVPRLWIDEAEPEVDAGPARPPPDYSAAVAHRAEEQRQARLELERSLHEEGISSHEALPSFDSEHPLVRNGLLRDRSGERASGNDTSSQDGPVHGPAPEPTQCEPQYVDEQVRYPASWIEEKRPFPRERHRFRIIFRRGFFLSLLCIFFAGAVLLGMVWEDKFANHWRVNSPNEIRPPGRVKAQLEHPPLSGCEWTNYRSTSSFGVEFYDYPPHSFSFLEHLTEQMDNLQLSGKIIVTHAGRDQDDTIRVTIEAATTPGLEVTTVKYDVRPGHEVELLPPDLTGWRQHGCLDFAVKIELQPHMLDTILVNTTNLDIDLDGKELFHDQYDKLSQSTSWGLKLENATFATEQGEIHGVGWASYRTQVATADGPVTGDWPLRHALDVRTQSGDIAISIVPQNRSFWVYSFITGEELDTLTSTYRAVSVNGTIRTDVAMEDNETDMPSHDYRTEVSTTNGDIYGDYLLGSNMSLKTGNGTMNVRIVPLLLAATNATIYTENNLGFSNVWIIDPISESDFHPQGELSTAQRAVAETFVAEHNAQSGSVHYVIPPSWSGTAVCETESGRLYDLDDAFEVLKNKTRQVIARRGAGAGSVTVRTTSGDILFDAEEGYKTT